MLKEEFEKRVGWNVSDESYRTVEHVYNYMSGMDKELAAMMYGKCGLKIFEALTGYADAVERAEKKVHDAEAALDDAKEELQALIM